MEHLTDADLPLKKPSFAPRGQYAIPTALIFDAPYVCARVNVEWLGHVLGVLDALDQPDAWLGTTTEIEDARNQVRELIASFGEVCMLPIGTILPFAGKLADLPDYTLPCDGTLYNRVDYPELYQAIDAAFILGAETFRVPDTRTRSIFGPGDGRAVGDVGGSSTHQLTIPEMPDHNHTYMQYVFGVDVESVGVPDPTGVGQPEIQRISGSAGGGQPHNNMPPYLVLNHYIIARLP